MSLPSTVYGALSRALHPPGGDPSAFALLGLPAPAAEALEKEHVVLFGRIGPAVLSPYTGVRTGTGLSATLDVFTTTGFAPEPSFRDRPDHVCVWLALLEQLARDAESAPRPGAASTARRRLSRFEEQHVAPWLPALFLEMALVPDHPIHRGLAHQANGLLLRGGLACATPRASALTDELPADVVCAECGKPLSQPGPEPGCPPPSWGFICVRCRLRTDLRRSVS